MFPNAQGDRVRAPQPGRRRGHPIPAPSLADGIAADQEASGRPFWPHGVLIKDPSGALQDPYDPFITPSPLNGKDLPSILPNGDFETSEAGWLGDANTLLTTTTAAAFTGSHSLELKAVGAAKLVAYTPTGRDGIPVLPGWVYRVRANLKAAATARTWKLSVTFYDSHGDVVGSPTSVTVTDATSAWASLDTLPLQAAPGALYVGLQVESTAAVAATEKHYLDNVTLTPVSGFSGDTMVVGNGNIRSGNYRATIDGWMIDGAGNAEFNNMLLRGLLRTLGGPNILPNGNFDADVTGWTANTGSISKETTGSEIFEGTGALKHVTAASGAETYVNTPESGSGLFDIDPSFTYRLIGKVKPGAVGDQCKVAIRWYDSAGGFIAETAGSYVTGVTAYNTVELKTSAPESVAGQSTYYPNSDVVALLITGNPANSFGTIYQNLDEGTLDTTDYITNTFGGFPAGYLATCSIASGSLTGKTPTGLVVKYWAAGAGSADSLQPVLRISGTDYYGDVVDVNGGVREVTATWATNPATGAAWTTAELEAFRSGGTSSFGAFLLSDAPQAAFCYKAEFRPQWSTGSAAAKASVRLYTDPLSAGGTTTRWDSMFFYKVSKADFGKVTADTIDSPDAALSKIGEFVLTGTTASVTFSNIPQTFSSLKLVGQAHGTDAALQYVVLRINGDTGAVYDWEFNMGNTGADQHDGGTNATGARVMYLNASTDNAAEAGVFEITIPNYTGTTFWKHFTGTSGIYGRISSDVGGRRRNTAAITSITFLATAGSFVAGSRFTLYGLK